MQEAKVAATRARRFVCGLRPFIGAVSPGTEDRESSGTSPRHTARFAAPLPRAGEGGAQRRVRVRLFTVLVSCIANAMADEKRRDLTPPHPHPLARTSAVAGKRVPVRVELGCRRR